MSPTDTEFVTGEALPAPFVDPLGTLRRRWRWMLTALVLGLLATAALSYSTKARYYAEATVVVSRQQISEALVERTIQEDSLTRIDALAAEVLSRVNLGAIVEEFDLYPELRDSETLGEIVNRVRGDVSLAASRTMGSGARGATAFVYSVGYEADLPEAAAGVANGLANLFVKASLARQHRQHQLTTEFLRRELTEAETLLRDQNREIAAFKQRYRGLLPSDLRANLTRLDLLQTQRQSLAVQIPEVEARIAESGFSPDVQLSTLRAELRRLRVIQTEQHPDMIALLTQIAALEAELAEPERAEGIPSPGALPSSAERSLQVLRQQLESTEASLAELDDRIEQMPVVQEELAALEGKALILRESYLEFLRKVQDAELAENLLMAQQGERISVLNRAEPPSKPVSDRWELAAMGAALSLALALGVGVAVDLLDPVIVSTDQVEQVASLPVLGSVGRIR